MTRPILCTLVSALALSGALARAQAPLLNDAPTSGGAPMMTINKSIQADENPGAAPARSPAMPPSPTPASDDKATSAAMFRISLTPGQARIGGKIKLEVVPVVPGFDPSRVEGATFKTPPDPDKWDVAENWGRPWQAQGQPPKPWRAELAPFDFDKLAIPPVEVVWRDEKGALQTSIVEPPPVAPEKIAPPPSVQPGDFAPLKGVAAARTDWTGLLIACGTLLAAAAAALIVWWLRRRPKLFAGPPPEPELPPGEWALREIERRSMLPGCMRGDYAVIYLHASEIVRLYLGRLHKINAIDMTTKELAGTLYGKGADDGALRYIHEFLNECDWVKFTDTMPPEPNRRDDLWNEARLIVRLTTPQAPGAVQVPGEAAA